MNPRIVMKDVQDKALIYKAAWVYLCCRSFVLDLSGRIEIHQA